MAQELRHIWSIEREERMRGPHRFGVYFTTEGGLSYKSTIPDPLPTHIAAAYGVDTSADDAADQVLDIILHQHHIPNVLDPSNWGEDVAFKAGMKKKIVNHPEFPKGTVMPTWLYTAETDEEAIEAHKMRIKEVKKRILYVPYTEVDSKKLRHSAAQMFHVTKDVEGVEPENPLMVMRAKLEVSDEELDEHRRHIQGTRLWTHGKKIPGSLRRGRPGPTRETREARPKQTAQVRQRLNFKFETTWD